jgi:hypothetical protein
MAKARAAGKSLMYGQGNACYAHSDNTLHDQQHSAGVDFLFCVYQASPVVCWLIQVQLQAPA